MLSTIIKLFIYVLYTYVKIKGSECQVFIVFDNLKIRTVLIDMYVRTYQIYQIFARAGRQYAINNFFKN